MMSKYFLFLVFLLLSFSQPGFAQTENDSTASPGPAIDIQAGEYFWDTDLGEGSGTAFGSINSGFKNGEFSVEEAAELANLSTGFHTLYIRFRDADNVWGVPVGINVYIQEERNTDITGGEIFVETEIENGTGQTFSPLSESDEVNIENVEVDISSLNPGFREIIVQLQNSENQWGVPVRSSIHINDFEEPNLQRLEVFLESDPGVGQGTDLGGTGSSEGSITEGLSTDQLQTGFNHMYARFQNSEGVWGPYVNQTIYLPDETTEAPDVAGMEYFFAPDGLPAEGEGNALSPVDGAFDSQLEYGRALASTPFNAGEVGLYARTRDASGEWGIPSRLSVDVIESRAIQGRLFQRQINADSVRLPNQQIQISRASDPLTNSFTTTDQNGFFTLYNLEEDTYTLSYSTSNPKIGTEIVAQVRREFTISSASNDVQYADLLVRDPFQVQSITPRQNTINISPDESFVIRFNRAVDTVSFAASSDNVHIISHGYGSMPLTYSFSDGDSTLTVTPTRELGFGDRIILGLADVVDSEGDQLSAFQAEYFVNVTGGGTAFGTAFETRTVGHDESLSIRLVDMNADGLLDLVHYSGNSTTNIDSLKVLLNSQNGFTESYSTALLNVDSGKLIETAKIAFGDYDLDGDADIAIGYQRDNNANSMVRIFENTGSNQFSNVETFDLGGPDELFEIKFADLNHDALLDLVVNQSGKSILVYENLGSEFQSSPTSTVTQGRYVETGDFTGDGHVDILSGYPTQSGTSSTIGPGLNKDLSSFAFYSFISGLGTNSIKALDSYDYNQDGVKDILFITPQRFFAFEEDNNVTAYLSSDITGGTVNSGNPTETINHGFGDFLDSGHPNMILISATQDRMAYFGRDAAGTVTVNGEFLRFENHLYRHFDVGDYDNDGDLDIAAAYYNLIDKEAGVVIQTNFNGNIPPTLEYEFEDQSMTTLQRTLEFDLPNLEYVSDDGTITFTARSSNENVATVEVNNSGLLTLTAVAAGTSNITIRATDDGGAFVEDVFDLEVQKIDNDPPVITTQIPDTTIETDESIRYYFSTLFSDADGLTYEVTNFDTELLSLQLLDDNQEFQLTPLKTGSSSVTLSASDQYSTTSQTFTVTVVQAVNDRPVIVYDKPDTVANPIDGAILIPIETLFSDPDGDELTYGVNFQNNGVGSAEFSPDGGDFGTLVISPQSQNTYGQFSVTVSATDPSFESIQMTFLVTFNDIPYKQSRIDRAQIVIGNSVSYPLSTMFGDEYSPSPLTYEIQFDGSTGSASQLSSNLSVQGSSEGTGIVSIRAFDGAFYSDTLSFPVEIVPASFNSISTDVTGSFYPNGVVVKKWGLLSIPGENISGTPKTILDELGGDFKLFALTSNGQYEDVTEFNGNPFSPAEALWFRTNAQDELYQISTPAGTRFIERATTLSVPDGWSFISTPYDMPTNYLSQMRRSLIWKYDHNREEWVQLADDDKLQPWTGYAVFSNDGDDIRLYLNGTSLISGASKVQEKDEAPTSSKEREPDLDISLIVDDFELNLVRHQYAKSGFDVTDRPVMPNTPGENQVKPGFLVGKHLFRVNSIPLEENKADKINPVDDIIQTNLFIPKETKTLYWDFNNTKFENQDWMMVLVNDKYVRKIFPGDELTSGLRGDQTFKAYIGPAEVVEKFAVPQKHRLYSNYPNPFNPTTTIQFALSHQADVTIDVYNMLGQRVQTVHSGQLAAGLHSATFNASTLASGVYLYRLLVDGKQMDMRKMTLIK